MVAPPWIAWIAGSDVDDLLDEPRQWTGAETKTGAIDVEP